MYAVLLVSYVHQNESWARSDVQVIIWKKPVPDELNS